MENQIHYEVHTSQQIVPFLIQINQFPALPIDFFKMYLLVSSKLRVGIPSGLFMLGFRTKTLYKPLMFPMCIPCPNPPTNMFYLQAMFA